MEITYSKAAVKVINGMDRPTKQRIRAAIEKIPEGDIKAPARQQRLLQAPCGRLAHLVFLSRA